MSPTAAEWLRFGSNIAIATAVVIIAWKAEGRSSRNESIRARQTIISEIRDWARKSIVVFTDITDELACSTRANATSMRALSAAVEEGRLFFENANREEYGLHKPLSHRGHRPRVLSWLVFAYKVAEIQAGRDIEDQTLLLEKLRGHFVSDCQALIFPGRFGHLTMVDLDAQFKHGEFMDTSDDHPAIVEAKAFIDGENRMREIIFT